MNILTVNLLLSTVVFWIAAGYVLPNIRRWGHERVPIPSSCFTRSGSSG